MTPVGLIAFAAFASDAVPCMSRVAERGSTSAPHRASRQLSFTSQIGCLGSNTSRALCRMLCCRKGLPGSRPAELVRWRRRRHLQGTHLRKALASEDLEILGHPSLREGYSNRSMWRTGPSGMMESAAAAVPYCSSARAPSGEAMQAPGRKRNGAGTAEHFRYGTVGTCGMRANRTSRSRAKRILDMPGGARGSAAPALSKEFSVPNTIWWSASAPGMYFSGSIK